MKNSTPLPLRVGEARPIFALELDPLEHLGVRQRAELQHLEQQPAEVREHRPRDRAALGDGARRKALLEVGQRHAAVAPIDRVERQPEQRAQTADHAVRQHAEHAPRTATTSHVLEPMPHAASRARAKRGLDRRRQHVPAVDLERIGDRTSR